MAHKCHYFFFYAKLLFCLVYVRLSRSSVCFFVCSLCLYSIIRAIRYRNDSIWMCKVLQLILHLLSCANQLQSLSQGQIEINLVVSKTGKPCNNINDFFYFNAFASAFMLLSAT